MLHVTDALPNQILSPVDGPVSEVVNPGGGASVCLVCEHASAAIPSSLGALGLADDDRYSHAVWDPGAEALARKMSAHLDAPLVLSRVSRLVYDCNRPSDRADAMPVKTEAIDIPGNRNLSEAQKAARIREIYTAFHESVSKTLDNFNQPPVFVTIHSFTPIWFGTERPTQIGLLHDDDPTLAKSMMAAADPAFRTELNQPYSAKDGVTHTLAKHATARGLSNVMIEIRNDLLTTDDQVARIANTLAQMLTRALSNGAHAA